MLVSCAHPQLWQWVEGFAALSGCAALSLARQIINIFVCMTGFFEAWL